MYRTSSRPLVYYWQTAGDVTVRKWRLEGERGGGSHSIYLYQYKRCYQELSGGDLPKHKWNRQCLSADFIVAHYFVLWRPSVLPALALPQRDLVCWHKLIAGVRRQSISSPSSLIARNYGIRTVGWAEGEGERRDVGDGTICNNIPFSKSNMPMKVFCIADPFRDSAVPDRISITKTFPQFSVYKKAGNETQSQ